MTVTSTHALADQLKAGGMGCGPNEIRMLNYGEIIRAACRMPSISSTNIPSINQSKVSSLNQ